MTIRTVIFDLGGVLVRTEDRQPRSELAARYGLTYEQIDKLVFNSQTAGLAAAGAIPEQEHWEAVCLALQAPVEELEAVREAFWGGDKLDHDLIAYIRSLRPVYQTALLSNAWTSLRSYLKDRWGILDAFDHIFISAECGLMKPDHRLYDQVIETLGIRPEEGVFVDDFLENIQGAQAAGLHGVHFRNSEQARQDLDQLLGKS